MWYVIGLIWLVLIVGVISVHNRRQRQRNAGRTEKMAVLLAELKSKPPPDRRASEQAAGPVVPAANADFRKKQRLLPQSTALLYYVFRTGLPDHEIFTGLTLADVLEAAPASSMSEPRRLEKLLAQRLDLVVCTKQLEVVAGVVIGAPTNAARGGGTEDNLGQCLQAAGIRIVRIDPAAAPRHHQVRELVYGEST